MRSERVLCYIVTVVLRYDTWDGVDKMQRGSDDGGVQYFWALELRVKPNS